MKRKKDTSPTPTLTREQVRCWAMLFDEDIDSNERKLIQMFNSIGVKVKKEKE